MAKELLLYSGIHSFVAEELINSMEEHMDDQITMRINSGGGGVQETWGIAAKVSEHGNVKMKVDGVAFSGAFNLLMYAKEVECLDVSTFMAHRAAYNYGGDSKEEKEFLMKVNADLRKQMESRIDSAKLKEIKGVTIADIFEKEERISVFFTASEMKQLGIVSKVNKLQPSEVKAFNETFLRIAAEHNPQTKETVMTLAELKEKHPSIYAEAVAIGKVEGKAEGIAAENDRIGAAMVFAHLDPEGVKEIIKSGKAMTATQQSEFALKAMSPENLAKIKADSKGSVKTDAVNTDGKDAEVDPFEKDIRSDLKLDKSEDKSKGGLKVSANGNVALVQEA